MKLSGWKRGAVVVTAGALAAVLIAGCAGRVADNGGDGGDGGDSVKADPGITDDSLTLGVSVPLSGPTAGPGSCVAAGLNAYLEAGNADGGFEFGDGKTRTVELKRYDDAYDPAKAVTNFRQMISENVFGMVASLGTPTNLAVMPIAAQEEFPQALLMSGTPIFSIDQEANFWSSGMIPSYASEAEGLGKMLVDRGEELSVAIIYQNDDSGKVFFNGFKDSIEGSDVELVAEATYEVTDTTVDAQITKLADSKADVLISYVTAPPLQVGALIKAQGVGWLPEVFLPSFVSSKAQVLDPSGAQAFPAVYTPVWAKDPANPQFAEDDDVKQFSADMEEYSSDITKTIVPHCVWGYITGATLEEAFTQMKEPTRKAFMEATREVAGLEAPLLLPGLKVDTTDLTKPAVNEVQVWQYNGTIYAPIDK